LSANYFNEARLDVDFGTWVPFSENGPQEERREVCTG
jgi:hypothetical protein